MSDYKLTDRRPIGEIFRKMGYGPVDLMVKKNVHPDTISYFSVIFAFIGGVGLYFSSSIEWLLLVSPMFFFLRLYCNMVDGMVAVKANKCSAKGEVINELPDRISDTIIFLGLGLSGHANMFLTFWVIFGMLFGTYIGVLGKSVGVHRQFGGIMSKQWRMFALAIGCWIQFFWPGLDVLEYHLSTSDVFNILILLGLVQTIFVRTRAIFSELENSAKG